MTAPKRPVAVPVAPRVPGPGKLSPRALARAKQLHEAGQSSRKIAEALKSERLADVAHSSVARALERTVASSAAAAQRLPPPDFDEGELPPLPPGTPIAALRHRLDEVRELLRRLAPRVERGEATTASYVALAKFEADLAGRVHEAEPPDPTKDPTNANARAMVHAQVVQSIEAAAARVGRVCFRCRKEIEDR